METSLLVAIIVLVWIFIGGITFGIARLAADEYEDGTFAAQCMFLWPFFLPVVVIEGCAKLWKNRKDK